MSVIEQSVRRPVTVAVCVLLVVIFGVIGLFRVPVQLTPNVDQPQVTVTTRWFGAAPNEIEREILQEQEKVLKNVDSLVEMRSKAVEGEATVTLKFKVGVNKDTALAEVRDKLRRVPEYPDEADEPIAEAVDSSRSDYMAWMLLRKQPGYPDPKFDDIYRGDIVELQTFAQEYIQPVLARAGGVAEVNVLGGREREMQVRVDMARLAARGLSINQLVDSLRQENDNVSAGVVKAGKTETSIRAVGEYEDPEEIRRTVIAYDPSGGPIYVADVADVVLDFKPLRGFVRSMGENVIAINAKRRAGTNVLEVMQNLQQQIDRVNTDILAPRGWGVELKQVYDQTLYVKEAVNTVTNDLITGAILASAVLFITLRSFGATMVVAVSMPISIVGTFLGMQLTGRNLNVISMAGLSFAIGMGVDNTIVVLENIFRHREMGKDRITAALDGTKEVWGAILAATLANMAVFLPVVFIEAEAGQLFKDISIAICISLVFYLIVSPTVIPMLATLFLRRMPAGLREEGGAADQTGQKQTILGRITRPIGILESWATELFGKLVYRLTGGLIFRFFTVSALLVVSAGLTWLLVPQAQYLPQGNQNLVFCVSNTPPGYSVEEMQRLAYHVEATIRPWWEAKEGSDEHRRLQQAFAEESAKRLAAIQEALKAMEASLPPDQFQAQSQFLMFQMFSLMGPPPPTIENFFYVVFNGQIFMGAIGNDRSNVDPMATLFTRAWEGAPGVQPFAFKLPLFNLGTDFGGGTLELLVTGSNSSKMLTSAGAVLGAAMGQNLFVQSDPPNFLLGSPELKVTPDRVRAAASGVMTADLRTAAEVAVDGAVVGDYRFDGRDIDLTIIAAGRETRGEADVAQMPVATRGGSVVPLESVAIFERTTAPQTILRVEEQGAVALAVNVPPNKPLQELQRTLQDGVINPLRESGAIDPSVQVRMEGSAAKLDEFLAAFYPGFILAAAITYLLLAALFESWVHPLVIILSVPSALVGGFLGLFALQMIDWSAQMDVLTMLGFVILIGTIVNNPILIVHQALNYLRSGMDRRLAIATSTKTRVRPIFMSVLTSVAGMAPLVIGGEPGSELYRPLGAVVVGGLLVSTLFTLILTPTLMSLMMDLQDAVLGLLRITPSTPPATPPSSDTPPQPTLTA